MSRGPTTTRVDLLRVGAVLIVVTVLTSVFAFAAVSRAQRTATSVRDDTVPALVEVAAARGALINADMAAVHAFRTDEMWLSGPGDEYRDQIAIANQNLTEAATHDLGDDANRRTLSLVNSLLSAYASAIEQAASSVRHGEPATLWISDLWQASRLLHADDGALALLDQLGRHQRDKLDGQVGTGTETTVGALVWLVPSALLLVLLVLTQVWLHRRFRRTVNPLLVLATVLVAGMVAVSALTFDTGGRLADTRDAAHELTETWQQRMAAHDAHGQQNLASVVGRLCAPGAGKCGDSVQRVVKAARDFGYVDSPGDELTDGSVRIKDSATASTGHGLALALIPIMAVLAMLAVGFGLYQRFDEYRFRSR